ncbi:MAG TPA: D-alanyl-D-alanine carboxypeptidase [Xanthobacteraceae bacterium]|nr:D-alanyl-D-alanine carboxypeptidase [Xanthobacteraceae bacterium]
MSWASNEARQGLRSCVLALAAIAAALSITTDTAVARHHHRSHVHSSRHAGVAEVYAPPTASIMVDGNTGAVLEESNPDAPRHPASLTKVMTLYLLFERLDAGKIRLDSPLQVSEHAAEQAPTKLGLKPGQTISVEDAIKGIVTRSANDAAVVIAENLGGSEQAFAKLMTQKARALGMSRTTYVNASGLPDDDQITTARDQALLGRAIQDRFPRYYRFFSTTSFVFRGETIRGHNHLLGSVPGVDGIKTGFTDASGFNLLTSVHRDGRYLVGVVLGGRSASERDAHMRALIASNIMLASARRGAPIVAAQAQTKAEPQIAFANVMAKEFASETLPTRPVRPDPRPTASTDQHPVVGSTDPIRPVVVKTISFHTVTVRSPTMKAMPVLVPMNEPAQPALAQPSIQAQTPPAGEPSRMIMAAVEPAQIAAPAPAPKKAERARIELTKAEPVRFAETNPAPQAQPHAHSGWVIQIGAYGGEDEARQHLNLAQSKLHTAFAAADPFTERVQKGDTTFYRARFAGFDKATAEAACRQLRRSDFACMALKD